MAARAFVESVSGRRMRESLRPSFRTRLACRARSKEMSIPSSGIAGIMNTMCQVHTLEHFLPTGVINPLPRAHSLP